MGYERKNKIFFPASRLASQVVRKPPRHSTSFLSDPPMSREGGSDSRQQRIAWLPVFCKEIVAQSAFPAGRGGDASLSMSEAPGCLADAPDRRAEGLRKTSHE